ncbi:hypothetical protein ACFQGT_17730 [Natrialbaceae archaeon GCM10025810]|uniref:DUF4129 domain-containing protein n=1 Tax=Halovalidus salilacus TaxID=3075124 RepID=UPI003618445A
MNDVAGRVRPLALLAILLTVGLLVAPAAAGGITSAPSAPSTESMSAGSEARVASAAPLHTGVGDAHRGPTALAVQESDGANDTDAEPDDDPVRHRNPDDYDEDGDLEGVEAWLNERLTTQLQEGAIQLEEGEYDLAREYVGEEYRDRLRQYVEVTGDTDGESDAEAFNRTGERQAELTEAVADYRETKAEYERAREAGDEDRARDLARDLEDRADEIEALGGSVDDGYEEIETETGADLSDSRDSIDTVTAGVQTDQAEVREREFTETELTLVPESTVISFVEPLVASGEVHAVEEDGDGAPLANEELTLAIGNHTERVETNDAGEFTLTYRPTDDPLSTEELTVEYVPDDGSTYLGDETTVDVSLEQAEPDITLDDAETSDEVGYGDDAAVAGELAVDETPVTNATLDVTLEGERIGTVAVEDGAFSGTADVPASVPEGEGELGVELPEEGRALAPTADTTSVTIRETESALSLDATALDEREVVVSGTLEASRESDGEGIEGEPVQIRIGGTDVATLTTDEDGAYEDTVTVPESIEGDEVSVVATYKGRDSNLASAEAESAVAIADAGGLAAVPSQAWLGGAFLATIAAAGVVWWYRRRNERIDPSPAEPGSVTTEGTSPDTPEATASPDAVDALLEHASEHLSSGRPDEAVQTGYAAVRRALTVRLDERIGALTHWEFYRRVRAVDESAAAALHDVTRGYEHATFDRDSLTTDEASGLLERARRICDGLSGGDGRRHEEAADD